MNDFLSDAWNSFKSLYGPVLTVLGVLLTGIGFFYAPTEQLNWKWAIAFLSFLCIIFAVLVDMLMKARTVGRSRLPKIITSVFNGPDQDSIDSINPSITLLMDSSELFGFNVMASIYYNQRFGGPKGDVFERLIGFGRISNIQEDKRMQLVVLRAQMEHMDIWRRIKQQEPEVLDQIVVKPSMPYESREAFFNE